MTDLIAQAGAAKDQLLPTLRASGDPNILASALGLIRTLIQAGEGTLAVEMLDACHGPAVEQRAGAELAALRLEALASLDRYREALDYWESWYDAHRSDTESPRRAILRRALLWASYCRWGLNLLSQAETELTQLYGELSLLPDSEDLGLCSLNLGHICWSRGELANAKSRYEEALVSARRTGARALEALCYRNLGLIARSRARWAESEELLSESLRLLRQLHNRNGEYHVLRALAVLAFKRGRLGRATELVSQCLATATALRSDIAEQHANHLLGLVRVCAGDWADAVGHFQRVVTLTASSPTSRPALLAHEFLGDVELEQGHAAEALKHYDEVWPRALALAPRGDIVAELRRRRAEAFLLLERRAEAYDEAKAALEHCRTLGDRYEEAATYRALALSAAAMGKPSEAQSWFEQGFAMYADIETPYEWGKLWMAYGDWVAPEDTVKAHDAYLQAERLWLPMGAKAKLAEVRAKRETLESRAPDLVGGAASPAPVAAEATSTSPAEPARPRRPAGRTAELAGRSAWALEHFGMVTRWPHLLELLEQVARLAVRDIPILILGESGVGKELVAHGIHKLSGRRGVFVPINCGGIPHELVESEMFGHTRGSFTGAQADKLGLFELGTGGTVFLDEVAEMPAEAQTRLLRFLESGEVRRVGQTAFKIVDSRVVAATNRPREQLEAGTRFRLDLYYRLGNAAITLPPLRQRGEDLALLLDHFWQQACAGESDPPRLSPEARAKLLAFRWPGNVRQLKQVATRIVATAPPGSVIQAHQVELEGPRVAGSLAEAIEEEERQHITEALKAAHGSRTEAARLLGMARTTLLGKMKRYGMMS